MSTHNEAIAALWSAINSRRIDRRELLKRATILGLSAPTIAALLAACGGSDDDADGTQPDSENAGGAAGTEAEDLAASPTEDAEVAASPTEESGTSQPTEGGGLLRLLWWQAPTVINPHLALGGKDTDASRVCYEPLANHGHILCNDVRERSL